MLISFFSSWTSRNIYLRRVFTLAASPATLRYNNLIYPFFVLLMGVIWYFFNTSDMGVQEMDFCLESLVIFNLIVFWVNQPVEARSKDVPLVVITVLCLRLSYFNDTEMSQNKDIPKPLLNARGWF